MTSTADLTQGSIRRQMIALVLPLLASNILQQLYNTVDVAIVGRYIGEEAFAAVGVAGSAMNLFLFLITGCCNGAGALFSQARGAGDSGTFRREFFLASVFGGGCSLALAALAALTLPQLLAALRTPPEIAAPAAVYLRVIFLGFLPAFAYQLGGKVYETAVLKEYLLYPQLAGALTVDPVVLTAVAQIVVPGRSHDPFFGGPELVNVRVPLRTQPLSVEVRELPAGAPESFGGAVGRFTLDATLPPDRLTANSSANYAVRIAGRGNLAFVQAPKLTLPGSFEQYNARASESIDVTASGMTGYRRFEYPFIARAAGEYEIPGVEFTYFDPSLGQYVTLESKAAAVEVLPDGSDTTAAGPVLPGRGLTKEEVKLLGQDIRFIKLGGAQLRSRREPFLFSGAYFIALGGIVLLGFAAWALLRKQLRDAQNTALLRGRRANKVAVQRFRAAKRHMAAGDRRAFYEEMLSALWGYMSDRFNIPAASLTKESVREELHRRGVAAAESERFAAIVGRCEEAQYSPVDSARMSDVYAEGVEFVSRIEAIVKR